MANLSAVRIPRDAVPVLERLSKLSPQQLERLVTALADGSLGSVERIRAAVADSVGEWTDEQVTEFASHAISLAALSASHHFTGAELAGLVNEAIEKQAGTEPTSTFEESLAAILEAPGLMGYSKAVDISREFDRLVHLSRVVTDVRPVFRSEPSEDPLGALIVHSLRLDFIEQGNVKSVSYAIDASDLRALRESLERAEAKAATLERLLDRAGVKRFDVTGGA